MDGEPVSKARARFSTHKGKVRTYTPEKTITGESRVREAFLADYPENADDANTTFGVVCVFYCGTRQRRDVDNMVKLVLDGLNETAWKDDNQVLEIVGRKTFVPKAEARTEVTVYRIGAMDYLSKACEHCGESFRTWESLKDVTRFCSATCRSAARLAARQTVCDQCGTVFARHGESHGTRFCSRACKTAASYVELICEGCGSTFMQRKSHKRVHHFCSPECRRGRTGHTTIRINLEEVT